MKNSLLIALCLALIISCKNEKKEQTKSDDNTASVYERVDANTNRNASKILALYAYGMAITKSYNCSNPASWYYQGSMHAVPAIAEISGSTDSLCADYDNGQTMRAWNSCPHMKPTDMQLNFLTWHRLYTYFYERNIRHQIANGGGGYPGLGEEMANQFSLPYWDYTNQGDMPKPFAMEDFTYKEVDISGTNPLYESGRSRTLLVGMPIDYKSKDSIAINVDGDVKNLCINTMRQALNYEKFLAINDVSEFSRGMEDRLHNVMHDYIGGAVDPLDKEDRIYNRIYQSDNTGFGLMGQIPSAGFDPIFFLHHANVDRMFAAWEYNYGPITLEDMNTYAGTWSEVSDMYQFWDSPTGSWVTYGSMQEMLDAAHGIDYYYESMPKASTPVTKKTKSSSRASIHAMEIEKPQPLDRAGNAFEINLAKRDQSKIADSKYKMEIDLAFGENMFQQLMVLTLPSDQDWNACDLDEDYVHSVSAFFGSTHGMHAKMHGQGSPGLEFSHQILVDVTHAVNNLPEGKDKLDVYVVPLNAENGPAFFIKKIELYEYK